MSQLRRFLYSIFSESTGTPVNFIIITDHNTKVIIYFGLRFGWRVQSMIIKG